MSEYELTRAERNRVRAYINTTLDPDADDPIQPDVPNDTVAYTRQYVQTLFGAPWITTETKPLTDLLTYVIQNTSYVDAMSELNVLMEQLQTELTPLQRHHLSMLYCWMSIDRVRAQFPDSVFMGDSTAGADETETGSEWTTTGTELTDTEDEVSESTEYTARGHAKMKRKQQYEEPSCMETLKAIIPILKRRRKNPVAKRQRKS